MAAGDHTDAPFGQPGRSPRRAFLATVGGLAGAALLGACGEASDGTAKPPLGAARDVHLLTAMLEVEHRLLAAYASVPGLHGARQTIELLREQESEHVRGLAEAVKDLGSRPAPARPTAEYRRALGLDAHSGPEDVWRVATRLENDAIASYLEALPSFASGQLRQTVSAIVASEAEHLALIVGQRYPDRPLLQAPRAFVTGRPA